MLTAIVQHLYNAADVIVVGRYAGEDALAGVGTTGSLTTLIINIFLGLSVGVNVVLGRALGAKDQNSAEKIVHTSMLISILGGALVSFIGIFFAEPLLKLIDVPDNVMPQAKIYMQIVFSGKIPALIYNFGAAILRSKGDTKRPLYIVTISGLINVSLNLFFVIGLKMKADGVALATVISQIFTAAAIIYILSTQTDCTRLNSKKLRIDKKQFVNIMKVGIPSGIQSSIFSIANIIIQSSVNSFGSAAIAGNAAAANLGSFYYVAVNTFSHASVTFVSQNIGAKKFDRLKKIILCCVVDVLLVWGIEALITVLFSKNLVAIYAPGNTEAIKYGIIRITITGCTYGICGLMDIMSGAIRGSGHSFTGMIISIIGVCGIRIVWIFTAFKAIGTFQSLFYSFPLSWLGTFIMHTIFFAYVLRKLTSQKNKTE